MGAEVELKLLVKEPPELKQVLSNKFTIKSVHDKKLTNTYFDTAENELRNLDIGLRIRSNGKSKEQTIKTSGRVTAGLHQRLEFNSPIIGETPDLAVFPADIWPKNTDVEDLQGKLESIFSTDFSRQQYDIEYKGSDIELVFDSGEVETNNVSDQINEIELELQKGKVAHLFFLADHINQAIPCRMGMLSKAARGYMLAAGREISATEQLHIVPLSDANSIQEVASKCLSYGLEFWQSQEEVFIQTNKVDALVAMTKGLNLILHILNLFEKSIQFEQKSDLQEISEKLRFVDHAALARELLSKKGAFRKKLEKSPKLMKQLKADFKQQGFVDQAENVIWSRDYCRVKLALTKFNFELSGQKSTPDRKSLLKFARKTQQTWLDKITQQTNKNTEFTAEDYLAFEAQLEAALLTGICLGGIFSEEDINAYRSPWLDLLHGLSELKALRFFREKIVGFKLTDSNDLSMWCNKKIRRTLEVMEQTRETAIELKPYW